MIARSARIVAASLAGLLALAAPVPADTVWSSGGGGTSSLPTEGTVLKIENGQLQMQSKTGNAVQRSLDHISKIQADGEKDLNEAEEAFVGGKFDVAAAAYDRALSSSRKDWVKVRSIDRLLVAAEKANQFPLSAAAFAQVAIRDPNAGDKKPAIPADKVQISKAIPLVERVFNTKQTDVLRAFLAELYIANGDLDKAGKLLAAAGPGARNPALVIMQAKAALASKNYAGAISTIEQNRSILTLTDQQFDALYTIAEAKLALAGNDPAKKSDAALAYMRVATHFADRKDHRVIDSLMKTAAILEQTGQPAEAAALYGQIAIDDRVRGTPTEAEAKVKAEQLKKSAPASK